LRDDLREAHSCHAQFVEWAASGDPALFGAQGEYLGAVVGVLVSLMVDSRSDVERAAEARLVEDGDAEEDEDKMFEDQYVSKDTRLAIEACLAKLQAVYPTELAQVWATLSEQERQTQIFIFLSMEMVRMGRREERGGKRTMCIEKTSGSVIDEEG